MGEKPTSKRPPSLSLVPVTFDDQYKRPPVQQAPWWTLCNKWLQFHTIQIRWDIERWLARLFHRRWGS